VGPGPWARIKKGQIFQFLPSQTEGPNYPALVQAFFDSIDPKQKFI
jgi:hypothetical protein